MKILFIIIFGCIINEIYRINKITKKKKKKKKN